MSLTFRRDGSVRGLVPARTRRVLWRRWIAVVLITSLAAVAFLVWGPIGLGSGPLVVYVPSGGQILGERDQAWGMLVPVQAGNSGAVIDQVSVVGGDGYRGPRVLSIREVADRPGQCGGTFPWQGPRSILSSCAIGGLHRLIGIPLPADNPGADMVIKVGPPGGPSGCWTAIEFVVHYHVGIRHYTVTSTGKFAACKTPAEEHSAGLAIGQAG
jgi:hypothetical protein